MTLYKIVIALPALSLQYGVHSRRSGTLLILFTAVQELRTVPSTEQTLHRYTFAMN